MKHLLNTLIKENCLYPLALLLAMVIATLCGPAHATEPNPGIRSFPKWVRVVKLEHVTPNHTGEGIQQLLMQAGDRYANIPYKEDMQQFGVTDYWQTRAELLKHKAGDCEDFAIAAYYDLLEAGIPENQLHIYIVYDRKTRELHAYLQAGDLVLDRRQGWTILTVEEAGAKYAPIYSINRQGWHNLLTN